MNKKARSKHIFLFQEQFVPLILAGAKTSTIRPPRKRKVQVGDTLQLRYWEGVPRRSGATQKIIGEVECVSVDPITIDDGFCNQIIACQEGFRNFPETIRWFRNMYGLPFSGVMYQWKNQNT